MADSADRSRPEVIVVREPVDVGSVVAVDSGDLELVVWRRADGVLCANDARCPHQWSHFASVGAVDGDDLVCTAHHWRFGADGAGFTCDARGPSQPVIGVATYPVAEGTDGTIEITLTPVAPPAWG